MRRLTQRYVPLLLPTVPSMVGMSSVLSLYASNASYVPPADVLLPLITIALIGGALEVAGRALSLGPSAAAIVGTLAVLITTTYGHYYLFLEDVSLAGIVVGRHRYLISLSLAVLVAASLLARRFPNFTRDLAPLVLVFGVMMLAQSAILSVKGAWSNRSMFSRPNEEHILGDLLGGAQEGEARDVYYILLDGYGRNDVLREIYGYDNGEFTTFLEKEGFYLASESSSNYIQTLASVASTLNMDYLEPPPPGRDPIPPHSDLHARIVQSRVISGFREAGYEIVAFETGLAEQELTGAEYYLSPAFEGAVKTDLGAATLTLTPFASQYMEATLLGSLVEIYDYYSSNQGSLYAPSYQAHRRRVVFTLAQLPRIAEAPGDYFVFAHVISPHPPFVFDEDGNALNPARAYSLADGSDFVRGRWHDEYIAGYRDQLTYLNRLVMASIEGILDNSDQVPIIIVQGDHGPGAYLDWKSVEATNLWERTSILNAYLAPPSIRERLYPSISPVNTFRIVLPALTGTDPLPLLPFHSYYSNGSLLIPLEEEDLR